MKAARFYGPGDVRIDDIPEPATHPGTVKVEVQWCGICGTDLHEYLEGPIFAPTPEAPHPITGESIPITLGHEFAGVVAEIGDGVTGIAIGDRVVVEPYIICGRCDACLQGKYNVCRTLGFVGLSGFGGGFSQYVVAEQRWIHPLGDLGTDVGALIEPLAVAYHAVKLSGARPDHSALVFGAGPIGLVTTAALKARGVEQVMVVEPAQVRKEKAAVAGADHVLDPTSTDIVGEVRELTKDRGADVAFECAGIDRVLKTATQSTRAGGKVDPFQFITGRIGLDEIVAKGFDELINNKESNVKILVNPTA